MCARKKEMLKCKSKKRNKAGFLAYRKMFNAEVQRAKRAFWKKKQTDIEELESTDSKMFWKEIGKIGISQDRRKEIPMEVKLPNGDISTNVSDILNVWKTGFEQLLNGSNAENIGDPHYENPNPNDTDSLNYIIDENELRLAINKLKNNKATGTDELPAEILKCDRLTHVLLKLFNKCFSTGLIPDSWKKGIISPIHKSPTTDRRDPLNYRGITLTSSVYKLYCNILNDRLSKWESSNKILTDNQNGFRKTRSTIDHVMTITSIIETRKLNNRNTFTAFIDFKKAYDSINRNLLFEKLRYIGIGGSMYRALIAIYDNVRCSVRLNGLNTEWFEVKCGLKQGCALSSILFNLYINDLIQRINELNVGIDVDGQKIGILAYADDIVLLAETESDLQTLLSELNIWCLSYKMDINQGKSKVIHFRNPSTASSSQVYTCGETTLQVVDSYMYLGLLLTQHLDYNLMAKQVAASASRALGLLISKCKSAGGFPFSTFTKLYDSTVGSIIAYGAAVWGCRKFKCIAAVQNRALRFHLGVGRYTPNAAVNGDTGWETVYQKQWKVVVNQWCRIRRMNVNRLNYKVYQWSVNHNNSRHKNWAGYVKDMFTQVGFSYLFEASSDTLSKRFIQDSINTHLKTQFNVDWKSDLERENARRGNGRNKLRTYRQFKSEYYKENYVGIIMPKSHRSSYAKFRMGVAPLRLETGRYEHLAEDRRVCFNCPTSVESEEHVIMDCPLYSDLRNTLFSTIATYP